MHDLTQRQWDARADLSEALRSELLGPAGGAAEQLSARERPTLRYLVGRLAPAGTAMSAEEDEGNADAGADDEDSDTGYASPITMSMNPSSIGVSFVVEPGVRALEITLAWGRYEPEEHQAKEEDGRVTKQKVFQRYQEEHTITVELRSSIEARKLRPGVHAEFLVRKQQDGRAFTSVFLVNRIESRTPDRPEDEEWLFQPKITVRAANGTPAFAARGMDDVAWTDDPDLLANELLYWNRPEYAIGHGCAVEWSADEGARSLASEVRTEILPAYELARVAPRESGESGLDMRLLGGRERIGLSGDELRKLLKPIAEGYQAWIAEYLKGKLLAGVPWELRDQALDHISACEDALHRMNEGIELMASNSEARRAFCFANRAMALQRERSVKALAKRRGEEPPQTVTARWRPFQLAFVLLNLPAMVDRQHKHRKVADLLWFPTGGGKTEAYLGLTAFALAYRRIRPQQPGYRDDAGVTVLMRYTLRLLTIQQFQRATALICACEYLRDSEGVWGRQRFSIGLWVGKSATPNSYSDSQRDTGAKEALERLAKGYSPKGGSPVQLLHCPWCGTALTRKERGRTHKPIDGTYLADDASETILIYCADENCYFSHVRGGIPAHTVDDQIYRRVPSLVIATVDKFAQMPFNGRTQALFGRVERYCTRHGFLTAAEASHPNTHQMRSGGGSAAHSVRLNPPDLVIQDELHLISGPLGTMVGLYETAVDVLSSVEIDGQPIGPKVVASTATVRRSEQQIGALFRRGVAVFPPPGIESTDSWFGTEIPLSDAPGRLYIGVSAPGKSVKTALVRVYAALLSRAKALHTADAQAGDPYMTLVGYFNSLRELGGAVRLVEDDVPGRMAVLLKRDRNKWPRRTLYEREELTSNKRAEEVPDILDKLERKFTASSPVPGQYPIDTILATNMISVGVDIDRLGLMVVNGQPKTTAEYIQATSRVGRQPSGLIVTVYNWTRPRDISHYERFRSYHSSLYRYVEATSVTPFSSRARDKGLEGVATALIRLGDAKMTNEQNAARFDSADPWVQAIIRLIADRAGSVAGSSSVADDTRSELLADLDRWSIVAKPASLCYSRRGLGGKAKKSPDKRYLLDSQEDRRREGVFVAPGSLREVENEVHVYLLNNEVTANGATDGDD